MAALRVAYVDHALRAFGAERSLCELLEALPPCEPERVLITRPEATWVPLSVQRLAAPLVAFRRHLSPAEHRRQLRQWKEAQQQMLRLLLRCQPDLVHANTTPAALCAALPARVLGLPLLWHVRDLSCLWPAALWLGPLATAILAVSRAVADHVRRQLHRRARVIVNGVQPRPFLMADRLAERRSWGWGSGEVVFGFVGQWAPWKRPDFFLQVAAAVAACEPAARFLLAGGEPADGGAACARRLAHLAASPELAGKLCTLAYRTEIAPVLAGLDVLLLPSRREPFGRVLVEAMLCGKPVMATAEAGPLEIVRQGETGWLLPPDQASWVEACRAAARHRDLLGTMGRQAREDALRRFHVDRVAEQLSGLYADLGRCRRER